MLHKSKHTPSCNESVPPELDGFILRFKGVLLQSFKRARDHALRSKRHWDNTSMIEKEGCRQLHRGRAEHGNQGHARGGHPLQYNMWS